MIHALSLEAVCFALYAGLLFCIEVSQRRLQPGLRTEFLHPKTGLQVRLTRLLHRLLFLVELLLCLLEGSLTSRGLNIAHLLSEVALSLGLHNGLTSTAKSTCTNGLRTALCTRNVCGTLSFALLDIHHVLHERVHELLGSASLGERLRTAHLELR